MMDFIQDILEVARKVKIMINILYWHYNEVSSVFGHFRC